MFDNGCSLLLVCGFPFCIVLRVVKGDIIYLCFSYTLYFLPTLLILSPVDHVEIIVSIKLRI